MSRRVRYSEDDEDEDLIHLRDKVKILKEVSIQIGEETREHNKYLRELDSRAESVLGSLSLNMDKVKMLARSGNNRVVFILLGFSLFVVIVIYLMNKF